MTAPDTCPIRGTPLSQQSAPLFSAHLHLRTPLRPNTGRARFAQARPRCRDPHPKTGVRPPSVSPPAHFFRGSLPHPGIPIGVPRPDPQIR